MLKKFIKSITITLIMKLGATRIGKVIMETLQNELVRKILLDAGFQQTIIRQSVYNLKDQNISNQIWVR